MKQQCIFSGETQFLERFSVLPFLAPRVFAPWPKHLSTWRRKHRASPCTVSASSAQSSIRPYQSKGNHHTCCISRSPEGNDVPLIEETIHSHTAHADQHLQTSPRKYHLSRPYQNTDTRTLRQCTVSAFPGSRKYYSWDSDAQSGSHTTRIYLSQERAAEPGIPSNSASRNPIAPSSLEKSLSTKLFEDEGEETADSTNHDPRLQPERTEFTEFWHSEILKLLARYDTLARSTYQGSEHDELYYQIYKWAEAFPTSASVDEIRHYWAHLGTETRDFRWAGLMIWHLHQDPEAALKMVLATVDDQFGFPALLSHVLDLITCQVIFDYPASRRENTKLLYDTVVMVAGQRFPSFAFTPRTLCLLITEIDLKSASFVASLYHGDSQEQKSSHASHELFTLALRGSQLDVLRTIETSIVSEPEGNQHILHMSVQRGAAEAFLRRFLAENDMPIPYRIASETAARLMQLGVRVSDMMCNAIIDRLTRMRSPGPPLKLAIWELWLQAEEMGVVLTDETLAGLFRFSRNASSHTMYRSLSRAAQVRKMAPRSNQLFKEILKSRQVAYATRYSNKQVLFFYERYRDLRPLRALGIVRPEYASYFNPEYLPPPDAETIIIMLQSLAPKIGAARMDSIWRNFTHLKSRGDSVVVELSENISWYHLVLKHAVRRGLQTDFDPTRYERLEGAITSPPREESPRLDRAEQYNHFQASASKPWNWAAVILEMMRDPPHQSQGGKAFQSPRPDREMWNMIFYGLAQHDLVEQIGSAVNCIVAQGWAPNRTIWHSLLSGLARNHRYRELSLALNRMAEARIRPKFDTQEVLSEMFPNGMASEDYCIQNMPLREENKLFLRGTYRSTEYTWRPANVSEEIAQSGHISNIPDISTTQAGSNVPKRPPKRYHVEDMENPYTKALRLFGRDLDELYPTSEPTEDEFQTHVQDEESEAEYALQYVPGTRQRTKAAAEAARAAETLRLVFMEEGKRDTALPEKT